MCYVLVISLQAVPLQHELDGMFSKWLWVLHIWWKDYYSSNCLRLHFGWERRSEDFERYNPPPLTFGTPPPITIHLAGESRAQELRETVEKEEEIWRSKVIVKETQFHVHRKGIYSRVQMLFLISQKLQIFKCVFSTTINDVWKTTAFPPNSRFIMSPHNGKGVSLVCFLLDYCLCGTTYTCTEVHVICSCSYHYM